MKLWDISHRNDLLRDRESDEAYLACQPATSYVLYFTDGGAIGLDVKAHPQEFALHWINIAKRKWASKRKMTAGKVLQISAPQKGPWVAVMVSQE